MQSKAQGVLHEESCVSMCIKQDLRNVDCNVSLRIKKKKKEKKTCNRFDGRTERMINSSGQFIQ